MTHTITVEMFHGGVWNNITTDSDTGGYSRVRSISAGGGITMRRGWRTERGPAAEPCRTDLMLSDRDDKYNPRNPISAVYGLVGRNTPCRITVDSDIRLAGEAASWQPVRNPGGDDYTDVVVAGPLRRLSRTDPLRDAMYRHVTTSAPVGYWPMDDGTQARRPASALPGGVPLSNAPPVFPALGPASVVYGTGELRSWLPAAPVFTAGGDIADATTQQSRIRGAVTAASTGEISVDCVYRWVSGEPQFVMSAITGNRIWSVRLNSSGGSVDVFEQTLDLAELSSDTASAGDLFDGEAHHVRLHMTQDASDVDVVASVDGATVVSYTATSVTLGAPRAAEVMWFRFAFEEPGDLSAGQLAMWTDPPAVADTYAASIGWTGEHADARFTRLCTEMGITSAVVGTAGDSVPMGPQRPATLLDLLAEVEATDGGFIFDTRTAVGLTMRTGRSLNNQTAGLALTYGTAGHLAPPLDPVIDDLHVRNDVTATRPGGSSARAELSTGALSVQAPPDGIGRSLHQVTVNPMSDIQLGDQAGWNLLKGTVDAARYPEIVLDLDWMAVHAPSLVADVEALDIGDLITIDDLEPDQVALILVGCAEVAEQTRRVITLTCLPANPYTIAEVAHASRGVLQSASATTAEALDTTETGVDINAGAGPDWTYEDDFDIVVGGERMTVTAVGAMAGTFPARTCTLTVTRSVNGVVKSHASGTAVGFAEPAYIGL